MDLFAYLQSVDSLLLITYPLSKSLESGLFVTQGLCCFRFHSFCAVRWAAEDKGIVQSSSVVYLLLSSLLAKSFLKKYEGIVHIISSLWMK